MTLAAEAPPAEAPTGTRAADPMRPAPFAVARARRETADTVTLDLIPRSGDAFRFAPGQFNMLYAFGVGEVPISISGDPSDPGRVVHTTRAVGAVTRRICALKAGDELGLRGPFGAPWPVADAAGGDVVVVAGGIGLAPLRPVLYAVLARREQYGRVAVLYGSRTPGDLLFRKELKAWKGSFDLDVHVTVDRAGRDWRGNVGVVTPLVARVPFEAAGAAAFVCGPEAMMRFTLLELVRRGVPPTRIWLSLERNMKCGIGLCGHCQCGPKFVCRDGPVFSSPDVWDLMRRREA